MGQKLDMGSLIAQRREELSLTQAQLAGQLDISEKLVAKWERGAGYPDITLLARLAGQLELSVEELLAGAGGEDTQPETLVQNTFAYAGEVTGELRNKVALGFLIAVTAVCGVGMFVCGLVDLVLNGQVTWSVYPITALVFSLAVLAPPLYVRRKRVLTFLISLSIFLLPFLYVLLWRVGLSVLFFTLAVPVTVLSLLYVWGIYLFVAHAPVNGWIKAAAIVGLSPIVSYGVNRVVALALSLPRNQSMDVFNLITQLAVAAVLLVVGLHWKRRR